MMINKVSRACRKVVIVLLSVSMVSAFAANNEGEKMNITVSQGELKGKADNGVTTFYGIPYAHNPFTKALRFKAPQSYEKWEGVLDATAKTAPVPQPGREKKVQLVGAVGDLILNIWAPKNALKTDKQLPVMVWLPGGAFIRADAGEEAYNGTSFAKNDTIVVTVNYRVESVRSLLKRLEWHLRRPISLKYHLTIWSLK
ncbi:carboxylesterase family protein [Psychrobacter sp. PP-21]|uniref:carboxylesterase family protein n=1 Tax=Psychrobacter sp. PP-21 TaxID=2957503 RepID=UPI0029B91673|nr:carboxylesterase family protein [Psychrobacter sp. PP-21]MDX2374464.1 carboxylesterase family protein [Psychrobacter sp. PP-21]